MRDKYINALQKGDLITDFFMVKESGIREAKNGTSFGLIKVCDKTGDIECKRWDVTSDADVNLFESIESGDVVKIRGNVDVYNDTPQIIITQMRKANDKDLFDLSDIVKTAPIDEDIMYDAIMELVIGEIDDEEYRKVCAKLYEDNKEQILYWPAGQFVHHAHKGGLLWHTYRMSQAALKLCEVYPLLDKSLLLAGTVLHDIGKLHEMDSNEYGVVGDYTPAGQMLGHLVMGAMMVKEAAKETGMSEEKSLLLQHMLASHHGTDAAMGSAKSPCVIEAFMLHEIDMIDMYAYIAEEEFENIKGGESTAKKIFALGTRLYKPMSYDEDEDA